MRTSVPAEPGLQELNTTLLAQDIRAAMPLPAGLDSRFEAALRHVLDHPGSLVRPRMAMEIAAAYDLAPAPAADLAIALEYFHTASLIFDDLPCMDDATHRRSAPCVHVAFGEPGAILSALALINRAYALAWRALSSSAPATQPRVMQYLEQRLGIEGLLNGQSLDLNYASLPHTREITERIAHGKTVSLIRLTLVLPAMVAGAPPRELRHLERIAASWGLAYQIVDDLKDVLQSVAETGKSVARDLLLDRPNTAAAIGVPAAVERLQRLIALGDRTLSRLLGARPALAFLDQLRNSLQDELNRVTASACEMTVRAES